MVLLPDANQPVVMVNLFLLITPEVYLVAYKKNRFTINIIHIYPRVEFHTGFFIIFYDNIG